MDDAELLSDYVRNRSERAFRELVGRHLALVYSSALRQVRDPGLAEDVSQGVFLVLAQRADTIRAGCALSGWLLTTTRYVAASALRARFRRSNHEFKAAAMRPEVQESEPADAWALMQADIDQALAKLTEPERDVVALRFFEGKSLADVARSIGVTEEAARKRVGRAVEKLRKHLAGKGIALTGAAMLGGLGSIPMHAPPAALAQTIAHAALVQGAAAAGVGASTGGGAALAKAATNLMFWTKVKAAMALVLSCLVPAVIGTAVASRFVDHSRSAHVASSTTQAAPVAPSGVALVLETRTSRFAGRVVDSSGLPLAAARVSAEIPQPCACLSAGCNCKEQCACDGGEVVKQHVAPGDHKDGRFEFSAQTPQLFLSVRADGYRPVSRRLINATTGDKEEVIKLVRAEPYRGRAILTNGAPAAGALVVPIDRGRTAHLVARLPAPSTQPASTHPAPIFTAADGSFSFDASGDLAAIVIVHDKGYGEMGADAGESGQVLQLVKWGGVHGQISPALCSAEKQFVMASSHRKVGESFVIVETGGWVDRGWFHINDVPPGYTRVGIRESFTSGSVVRTVYDHMALAHLDPGQSAHLNLGALPQPTTEPAGPAPVVIAETLGSIRIPGAAPSTQPFITGQLSSRGKTKSPTMMAVRVNEQGRFAVHEVPPGKYVLELQVYDPARIGQGQELASLIRFIDVPGPGKVDLGELRLLPGPWR